MANDASSSCCLITDMITDEHLFSILLLLPLQSILSFSMTCKKTIQLTHSPSLWKSICIRDWGHSTIDSFSNLSVDWNTLYQRLRNLNRVSCFNLTTTTAAPTARASHSLNFLSGCLVLFGGGSEGGRHLDDTWISYVSNGSRNWKQVICDNGPSGRFGHSCVAIGNSLVLFGGINDSGIRQNDTWIAQVNQSMSWRLLDVGPLAPPTRGAHACCSIDNTHMLIHGGIGLSGTRLGDTWVLHLSDNLCFGTWHEKVSNPVPSPRSGHTLTCIGENTTVLFGGRGIGYEVLNDVWSFDSNSLNGRWVQIVHNQPQSIPSARVGHSATSVFGSRLLIYGGEDSYRHRKNDFWLLDIHNRNKGDVIWKKLNCEEGEPKSRSFHRACTDESGRFLYVFGGMVDGILQPAQPAGLRFDGQLFVVELLL